MNRVRRTLLVVLVAVLGIALAAAITWGTSQLVRQRIGLASEPLTAGSRLLPPTETGTKKTTTSTPQPASTTSTQSRTQAVPVPSPTEAQHPAPSQTTSSAPSAQAPPEPPAASNGSARGDGGDSSSHRDD
jgi:hypothetical protein